MPGNPNSDGYTPQRKLSSGNTPFNALMFLLQQALGRVNVATLVQVQAVHTEGRTAPAGTVDVVPLVDQLDGAGKAVPHSVVYGIPFFRLQGGDVAVIVDPKPGDLGFCIFADRDISKVKAGGKAAPPGSLRRFDMADGLYLGGWNNASPSPTAYLVIDDASADLVHPVALNLTAPAIKLDGAVEVTGDLTGDKGATFQQDAVAGSISLMHHKHPGVQTGSGQTGEPL